MQHAHLVVHPNLLSERALALAVKGFAPRLTSLRVNLPPLGETPEYESSWLVVNGNVEFVLLD